MSKLVQHLHDNKGETNVSKMVLVAIVFVVGVVLLVMTTSAFKGPIANWWQARAEDWFADSTGKFAYENDAFWMYERNDNGTYKGVNLSHVF